MRFGHRSQGLPRGDDDSASLSAQEQLPHRPGAARKLEHILSAG
jgi:hypothetical protein